MSPDAIGKTCLMPTVTTTSPPEIKGPIPSTTPNSSVFLPPSIPGGANILATFEQAKTPDITEKSNTNPDFQVATSVLPRITENLLVTAKERNGFAEGNA